MTQATLHPHSFCLSLLDPSYQQTPTHIVMFLTLKIKENFLDFTFPSAPHFSPFYSKTQNSFLSASIGPNQDGFCLCHCIRTPLKTPSTSTLMSQMTLSQSSPLTHLWCWTQMNHFIPSKPSSLRFQDTVLSWFFSYLTGGYFCSFAYL